MGVSGDAADLIVKSDSGIICESDNSIILAASITELSQLPCSQREIMGINGRNFIIKNFSLIIGVSKFISIFKGII